MELVYNHPLFVTVNYAIGFMSEDMESIVDHSGERMGAARIVTSWRINAFDHMYQVEGTINSRLYTGRTLGTGRLWRGKVKRQCNV
jgi:hypothetical protein